MQFEIGLFKAAISLYQSSLGRKNLVKLKETQLFYSVIKATITRCDLSPRFFCIDATLLWEFESDKI